MPPAPRDAFDVLICTAKDQADWRRALAPLLPGATVHVGPDAPPCDYAVVWKPPVDLFAKQMRLKAIFSLGAGVDGLLAMPAWPTHVPLIRMEDVGMADQMVEYALYVALRKLRAFAQYEQDQTRQAWQPRAARTRSDLRIGVLGLGVLGGAVARALAEFGFSVMGWSRTPKALDRVSCQSGLAGLDRVLECSELLLVFLPLTPATAGLLDRERLQRLPAGAWLANLSRGEIADEAALLALLDAGHVAQAHLDVFRQEPLPAGHPFWRHPGVQVTPHVAALTDPVAAAAQVAHKIRLLQAGRPVSGRVDAQSRY